MKLMSKNFADKGSIPSEFTCDGKNVSPHLVWENVPEGTKSFALTVTDPDAVGGWNHWLLYDIPKNVKEIEKNRKPAEALEVENDFGKKVYGGPCPPSGTHRYFFTVYALDVEHLEGVNKRNFLDRVEEHTIEKAEIIGLYKRRR
ncbi:MAG: YbhB/YbcL family Raf kinase inhibitor-like protein [Candidatus Bathyarchaeum sp.]|nr:MAG: YbhB/YbcL family Raf kinase inhibitor-like protein [Candidatus Bathyarchaeum sp.]